MSWNYRVLAHIGHMEVYLQIHEVYYDKDGTPDGYTANPITVGGDNLKELSWVLSQMRDCLDKPILYEGDRFPEEYKVN